MYSLVDGLDPGSSGGTGWFILLFLLWCCKPLPWVLSLAPPLGTVCSVQWIAVSSHFCISQALAEPLRSQQNQTPVSKHLLASIIVFGLGNCIWDRSLGGTVTGGLSFSFCHKLCLCISYHGYFDPISKRYRSLYIQNAFNLKKHKTDQFLIIAEISFSNALLN